MANHLTNQKSRYLLQHAENPVDWYSWSSEPFERAERERKPLLVSIGYSSCHWCHVMAHESFEDPEIARLLNEHFIAIKVDKEELPDVDAFYMEFLTQLAGRGGWPLNVFVNHHRAPFYGTTYLPKEQLADLLAYLASEYAKQAAVREQKISRLFAVGHLAPEKIRSLLGTLSIEAPLVRQGAQFPQALYLVLALRRGKHELVREELESLITKGLFDHVEGGWFRYSVDPDYRIPHFEKMLCDQAALLFLCAEAYELAPALCAYAIRHSLSWLTEKMRLPNGLYGSATDADTGEGEGFYYTEPVGAEEGAEAKRLFRRDQCGEHEGRFLPWIDLGYYLEDPKRAELLLERYRLERSRRLAPALDEKAVVSWNCFLGFALLRCAERLGDAKIGELAVELAQSLAPFVRKAIPHVIYGTEALEGAHYLEDYSAYLLFAAALQKRGGVALPPTLLPEIKRLFLHGDYLFHSTERVFESLGRWQDTPAPSGGALLLTALLELGESDLWGLDTLAIAEVATGNPAFFGLWCCALDRLYGEGVGA